LSWCLGWGILLLLPWLQLARRCRAEPTRRCFPPAALPRAALVLALAHLIMSRQLPLRLRVLVPAVENSISGGAFRPLDVLQTRSGLTVEVGRGLGAARAQPARVQCMASPPEPACRTSLPEAACPQQPTPTWRLSSAGAARPAAERQHGR
jgi:hypothetical protein